MIPQRGEDGDGTRAQDLEEHLYLLETPKIGEISPNSEEISVMCGVLHEGVETLSVPNASVDIGGGRDLQDPFTPAARPNTGLPWWLRVRRAAPTLPRLP